jgi:hypothetical protein
MSVEEHLLIVTSTIDASVERDWNLWYNDVHLPEIAECPGFKSAQRYVSESPSGERSYVAIYELAGPEAIKSAEFGARRGWGPFGDKVKFKTQCFSRIAKAGA